MWKITRCPWCGTDPLYIAYHDEEWWVPVHDDRILFEFLTLEWAQAGLSWITVLHKRENYRKIFHHWDIERIANMRDAELEEILLDASIIRNRLKIFSVRKNAKIALEIQQEFGSLDIYLSRWIDNKQLINHGEVISDFPTESDISRTISKDLKRRGMSFVGSTIIYAFMQAIGMVDDHIETCFRKSIPHRDIS